MDSILKNILGGKIFVVDDAIGSTLMQKGLHAGDCPKLLNFDKPFVVNEIAQLYLKLVCQLSVSAME